MRTTKQSIWLLILAGVTVLLLANPTQTVQAHANDRMLRVEHTSAGPYQLTIWSAPNRLRTGEIHIETLVLDQEGAPDRKCAVYVKLTPLDASGPALSTFSVPMAGGMEGLREAAFKVADPGRYQVETTVVDGTGEGGSVVFEVEVIRVSPFIRLFISLMLGASILAGVWMIKKGISLWFGGMQLGKHAVKRS